MHLPGAMGTINSTTPLFCTKLNVWVFETQIVTERGVAIGRYRMLVLHELAVANVNMLDKCKFDARQTV